MRAFGVALVLSALVALAGCGGAQAPAASDDPRPSAELIEAALLAVGDDPDTSYTPAEAGCIARILVASDLSDDALQGIAAGVPGFEQSEADKTRYRELLPDVTACLVDSLPAPSRTG